MELIIQIVVVAFFVYTMVLQVILAGIYNNILIPERAYFINQRIQIPFHIFAIIYLITLGFSVWTFPLVVVYTMFVFYSILNSERIREHFWFAVSVFVVELFMLFQAKFFNVLHLW